MMGQPLNLSSDLIVCPTDSTTFDLNVFIPDNQQAFRLHVVLRYIYETMKSNCSPFYIDPCSYSLVR